MGCPRAAALVAFAVASLGVAPAVLAQLQMSPEDFCPEAEGRHLDCIVTRLADNDAPPAEPDQRLFPLNGTTFAQVPSAYLTPSLLLPPNPHPCARHPCLEGAVPGSFSFF